MIMRSQAREAGFLISLQARVGPPIKVQEKNLKVDRSRALGYSGIYDRYKKSVRLNVFKGSSDRAHEVKR